VPSAGSISILRSSEALRVPCYVRAKVLAPFRPERSDSSHQGRAAVPRYSVRISVCLAAPLDRAEKMPLPDLCNRLTTRAPVGSFDFRARSLRCVDRRILPLPEGRVLPCDAGPPCGDPTPAGRMLDGTPPASAGRSRLLLAFRLGVDAGNRLCGDPTLAWRCRPGAELAIEPLTLPVVPLSTSGVLAGRLVRNQDRFHRPLVNEDDFPDPERLPSTGAPKAIALAIVRFEGTRHRSRGFATDDSASDALSRLQRSRAEELDPFS
jgi:hypothetical protein